jgi:hypothetical protein
LIELSSSLEESRKLLVTKEKEYQDAIDKAIKEHTAEVQKLQTELFWWRVGGISAVVVVVAETIYFLVTGAIKLL